jgi:hypothetical protein
VFFSLSLFALADGSLSGRTHTTLATLVRWQIKLSTARRLLLRSTATRSLTVCFPSFPANVYLLALALVSTIFPICLISGPDRVHQARFTPVPSMLTAPSSDALPRRLTSSRRPSAVARVSSPSPASGHRSTRTTTRLTARTTGSSTTKQRHSAMRTVAVYSSRRSLRSRRRTSCATSFRTLRALMFTVSSTSLASRVA